MKKIVFLLAIPLLVASCNGQTKEQSGQKTHKNTIEQTQPKANIKVNKIYDDEGNLIRYDSIYTWSYSNREGDSVFVDIDSLMSEFHPFIKARRKLDFSYFGNEPFIQDSIFYHDFLNNDYFMHRWENNLDMMNRMMQEMDSLKSRFLFEYYPELE